jgi:PPM family protein phosphatase
VIGYDEIEHASLTDVGIRRSHNQDAYSAQLAADASQWQDRGHIFLVADGMGAHAVGELASELAVGIIPHTYQKYASEGGVPALRKAFVEANTSIHAKGQQNPEFGGMGTTTTALLLKPEGAWIGHVGDSRAYRIRGGRVEQLTFDHSLVWEMARRQGVQPENLQGVPSNVIVRSLGPEPLVQIDVEGPYTLQPGDTFVLCSDGLSGQLSDTEIGAIASCMPPAEACRSLVDLANLRGGPDNITVTIVRVCQKKKRPARMLTDPGPWYRRIPWPMGSLLLGLLLVGEAVYLFYNSLLWPSILSFFIASAAIFVGLVGLGIIFAKEQKRLATQPPLPATKVYRDNPCRIDRTLVEQFSQTLTSFRQQIVERQWDADWTAYQRFENAGAGLLAEGNFDAAFEEYCRAMHLLSVTVQARRPGGEVFLPLWQR